MSTIASWSLQEPLADRDSMQTALTYDRSDGGPTTIDSLLAIKIVAALSVLAMGIIGGAIPILAARGQASHRVLSLGNALAGGIFLGAGFLHLLPEAGEALEGVSEYPLAPLLAAIGVCLLLLIDRVVLESMHTGNTGKEPSAHRPIYPLVLLVVLSVHSIIAGIALGLEAEVAASVLVMVAILCHKGSAAFALVVSVYASGADTKRVWRALAVFVSMTPAGIVIGTVATNLFEGPLTALIEGSFNALAAGTFIYVAILDVISAEMSRIDDRVAHFVRSSLMGSDDVAMPLEDSDRMLKFFLVLVGFAGMAVLGLWV